MDSSDLAAVFTTDMFSNETGDNILAKTKGLHLVALAFAQEPVTIPAWKRVEDVGQRQLNVSANIDLTHGTANAQAERQRGGTFNLSVDADVTIGKKDISVIERVSGTFERQAPGAWKLIQVSCVEVSLTDASSQTVQVLEVTATVGGSMRLEITDPSALKDFQDGLPIFAPGEEVVVTVHVENQKDGIDRESVVYLHHDGMRERMFDDGPEGGHGDEVAGDGVFTASFTVDSDPGLKPFWIDALDAEIFQDETTENYNGEVWAIPYRVQVPAS
jgi:hypothetical protein